NSDVILHCRLTASVRGLRVPRCSARLNSLYKLSHSECGPTPVSAQGARMALVILLALCGSASSPVFGDQTTTAPKPAPSKKHRKSKIKKPAARTVHKPTARTVLKPTARTVVKPTARAVRKPVPKPPPPSADIPTVAESASVWRGCL